MQVLLVSGTPEDGAVEQAAVLKAVGKAADIDGAPISEGMDRKLHFFFTFDQHFSAF